MHECDKDERIRQLERLLDESIKRTEIIKIILTPKVLLSITLAIGMVCQVFINAFK